MYCQALAIIDHYLFLFSNVAQHQKLRVIKNQSGRNSITVTVNCSRSDPYYGGFVKLNVHRVNFISLRAVMLPFSLRVECCLNCSIDQRLLNEAVFLGTKQEDEEMKKPF